MANTFELRAQLKTQTIPEDYEESYKLFLRDGGFETSPNYMLIDYNLTNTQYKTFILDYDIDKNLVGYKKLVSYPYDTQVFFIGDYVRFQNNYWLIFAIDNQFIYNVRGKIKKCNNMVKWIDLNGVTREYPCVIDDKINNSDLDQNKYIVIPQGGIICYLQQNAITRNLKINDRFILGKQAWKINALIDYSSTSFMTLIMQKDNFDVRDDLANQIAYNGDNDTYSLTINQSNITQNVGYTTTLTATVELDDEIVAKNVVWTSSDVTKVTVTSGGVISLLGTGSATITCSMEDNSTILDTINITINSVLPGIETIIISPDNKTIKQGQTQIYNVYGYIDGVIQAHVFTITGSGIPTPNTYYTLTTGNNTFTVKNLKAYSSNDLVITCINQTTTTVKTYNIKLSGLW